MVSKVATDIKLQTDLMDPKKCCLINSISGSGFSMMQHDKTRFPVGMIIMLITQPFAIFSTGVLSYYA